MQDLTLRFPVSTAEGRELLPAGEILSDDFLRGFAGSSRDAPRRDIPFLEYGTIRRDLSAYMHQDVYRHIFGEPDEYATLLTFLERVRLPAPVFDILLYFQRNDIYTYRHILIVSALTCLFARGLAENIRDIPLEASAAPPHDLGKVSVPLELLKITSLIKPTVLTISPSYPTEQSSPLGYYLGDA